jgi:hypothetical protein
MVFQCFVGLSKTLRTSGNTIRGAEISGVYSGCKSPRVALLEIRDLLFRGTKGDIYHVVATRRTIPRRFLCKGEVISLLELRPSLSLVTAGVGAFGDLT